MGYDNKEIGKQIIAKVLEKSGKYGHPRIMFTADRFEYLRQQYGKDNVYGKEIANTIKMADSYMDATPSVYNIYDGVRLLQISRNVLDRVCSLSIAYNVTKEKKYLDRALVEMDAAAAFPDWHPYHFLDVGELCDAFACGYDWLYSEIDEDRKANYRRAMIDFGFRPAMEDYLDIKPRSRSYPWYQDTPGDNWKLVCNGGETMAALAICDEDDTGLSERVLYYGFINSYDFIRHAYLELDGSYVESPTYWSYATQYLARYASSLVSACGEDFGLTDCEGMRKTGYFLPLLCSNGFKAFNFGDAGESFMSDPSFLWIAHHFKQPEVASFRYKYIKAGLYTMLDLYWLYPEDDYEKSVDLPTDYGCLEATNATFRTGYEKDDLYCGVHFGKNAVPHGHHDMGTFILEYGNERFIYDLGSDNYNINGYGKCYRLRGEGHNTLVFNPNPNEEDLMMAGEAYISKYKSSSEESFAICEMTSSYRMKSVFRGMKLIKPTKTMLLQDEIVTNTPDDWGYWFAHTHAAISLSADRKTAILEQNGYKLKAVILGDGKFSVLDAQSAQWSPKIEGQAVNEAAKLTIALHGKTEYTVSVAFAPADVEINTEVKALNDWN